MKFEMDEMTAKQQLEANYEKAELMLNDVDSMERFLQRLEHKLQDIPVVGDKLAVIPILVSLVRNYIKKEYTEIPRGTIIAIISALIYFLSPVDILPDSIPVLGYFDDAAVVAVCWKLVETDVEEYLLWRDENHKVLI